MGLLAVAGNFFLSKKQKKKEKQFGFQRVELNVALTRRGKSKGFSAFTNGFENVLCH